MIVVTGGAGFIGSQVVNRLVASGRRVLVLDSFDDYYDPDCKWRNIAHHVRSGAISVVVGDVRDSKMLAGLFSADEPVECVIHLAARAGVRPSLQDPAIYIDVNVTGTMRVLEAAHRAAVPHVVIASSSSVYGDSLRSPFREGESEGVPASPYGASKCAMEVVARTWAHLHGVRVTALRFFTAYGPGQRPDMAIHSFARLIEAGAPVPVFGRGDTRRDYTYVGDIADGVLQAMARREGPVFREYNLGREETVELNALISAMEVALGRSARREHHAEQPGDVRSTAADCSRARAELGYEPRVSLAEGLGRFVSWFRTAHAGAAVPDETLEGRRPND